MDLIRLIPTTNSGHFEKREPSTGASYLYEHEIDWQENQKRAGEVGVAKAANSLELHESQFYSWRKQFEHAQSVSEREASLATENARLKRQLAQQA